MSRTPQIEEVDDDPEDIDISELLPTSKSTGSSSSALIDPRDIGLHPQTKYLPNSDASQFKLYQCIYPVYFDGSRSRADGRKVGKKYAVQNPLAREIVDICTELGLKTVFEPGKTHPKDWANPGRVKVLLKMNGIAVHGKIRNKFALYQAVGSYLKTFPATVTTPLKLRYPDLPFDGKPAEPPAVPRGWKLSSILPLHSGALSGGGISEDIFREMMQGMGMNVDAGNPSSSLDKKDKKDKKKGKR